MNHLNPAQAAIYRSVVRPALNERKMTVEGVVMHVSYEEQTVRVYWKDPTSGTERESADVPMQQDGAGVFSQAIEAGDRVTLGFKNGSHQSPYVSVVHHRYRKPDFSSKNGAGIPKGMSFW